MEINKGLKRASLTTGLTLVKFVKSSSINSKTITWLLAVASSLLVAGYGTYFWRWQQQLAGEESVQAKSEPAEAKANEKPFDPNSLAVLFGEAKATQEVAEVKESALSLKLLASYVAKGGRSAAVLGSGERKQQLLFVGDEVQPGVELVKVQARRVLIKRNGVLESINLVEADKANMLAEATPKPEVSQPLPVTTSGSPAVASATRPDLLEKLNKLKSLTAGEN